MHTSRFRWMRQAFPAMILSLTIPTDILAAHSDHPAEVIARYHNRYRLVLIFAPGTHDTRFRRQTALLGADPPGMRDRDLVILDAVPGADSAQGARRDLNRSGDAALRRRYRVGVNQFRVVLLGKDGHVALEASHPVAAKALFALIDTMPMRRDEMRRKGR